MRVTFGAFSFDSERRLLLKDDTPVHLSPKAFDLLALLIERRPKVVSKALLMERLWPKTFVAENGIATLVNDLRVAVGDHARDPKIIRTAHGVGYAFVANAVNPIDAPVTPAVNQATSDWLLVWHQTSLPLMRGENIVGRPATGVIGIDAATVSRQHARIVIDGDRATVEDLASKNGTWLGSTRVEGAHPVTHGEEIRFGLALVRLVRVASQASTKTAAVAADSEASQDISRNS